MRLTIVFKTSIQYVNSENVNLFCNETIVHRTMCEKMRY